MFRDLRVAFRTWVRRPTTTAMVVVLLAVGIGANVLVFSLVQAMLLRPLDAPHPERLARVYVTQDVAGGDRLRATTAEFFAWRREARTFQSLVAGANFGLSITESAEPLNPMMREVSSGYFETFGVSPMLGRGFTAEEHRLGAHVAILEYSFWQSYYGGDPEVVGRSLELADEPYEVIGVMPGSWQQLAFPQEPVLWTPMRETADPDRITGRLVVLGRLADGRSMRDAERQLAQVQEHLTTTGASDDGRAVRLLPLRDSLVETIEPALWALFGAISLMLLIVLSNVAHLLLARAIGRRQEMGVRLALGANLGHLARQLLTEGLALGGLASALGIALAAAALPAVLAMAPTSTFVPLLDTVRLDGAVMAYAAMLTLATGILCALLPLFHARGGSASVVRPDGRVGSGRQAKRWRAALVAAEVGLSLALLVGAGLMVRSFVHLRGLDLGFEPSRLLVLRTAPRGLGFETPEAQRGFYDQLMGPLRAIPGVESAALCEILPMFASFRPSLPVIDVDQPPAEGVGPRAVALRAGPGYFATVGTPILAGRGITTDDRAAGERVAVLSRAVARSLWGDADAQAAIGRRIRIADADPLRVVGVAADLRGLAQAPEAPPVIYLPLDQDVVTPISVFLRVRSDSEGDVQAVFAAAETEIYRFSRELPVYAQATLSATVRDVEWQPRFVMQLLGIFAGLALVLTALGIYAVVSFAIAERTREIGVRVALGADRRQILAWVLGDAGRMTAAGIALGLVLSAAGTRWIESQLQGVHPFDPATWTVLALAMAAIGLFAAWLPARRALAVDPVTALKSD